MSKKHSFSFEGGNHLSRIGATYYVCYLYYLNCDFKEKRWEEVKTTILRNKKNREI